MFKYMSCHFLSCIFLCLCVLLCFAFSLARCDFGHLQALTGSISDAGIIEDTASSDEHSSDIIQDERAPRKRRRHAALLQVLGPIIVVAVIASTLADAPWRRDFSKPAGRDLLQELRAERISIVDNLETNRVVEVSGLRKL